MCLFLLTAGSGLRAAATCPQMNPSTVEAMVQVIDKESTFARMKAATALGDARVKDAKALKALQGMLKDEYAPARASAVYALGRSRQPTVAAVVAAMCKDPDALVRAEACRALVDLQAKSQASTLPLADEAALVRQAALAAAASIGQGALEEKITARFAAEKEEDLRAACLAALRRLAAKAGASVARQGLQDEDLLVQIEALAWIAAVASDADAEFRDPVKSRLASSEAMVRRTALQAWARLTGGEGEAEILPLLQDKDHTVRCTAALMLGRVGKEAARPALVRGLADPVREVRRAASVALVEHARRDAGQRPSIEALAVQATRSDNPNVQREGIWMLGELRSKAGFPDLLKLALPQPSKDSQEKSDVRASALVMWVIARTAYRDGGDLATAYFSAPVNQELRIHGARAIGTIKYEPARRVLCQTLLKTKSVMGEVFYVYTGRERRIALWALTQIGGDEVLTTFARIAGNFRPLDEAENFKLICDYLVAQKYVKGVTRMKRCATSKMANGTHQAAMLADAIEKLTGEEIDIRRPEHNPYSSGFFLNVKE